MYSKYTRELKQQGHKSLATATSNKSKNCNIAATVFVVIGVIFIIVVIIGRQNNFF